MDLLTDTPTPVADSSPAPISGQSTLDNLNHADRQTYELTGEIPDVTAESSPAAPDDQAASTEAPVAPASEPGTPTKPAKGADARKEQLRVEIETQAREARVLREENAALRREREALSRPPDVPPAASSPAAVPDGKPLLKEFVAAVGEKFESYEDAQQAWLDATSEWSTAQARKAQYASAQQTEIQLTVNGFQQRLSETVKADPQFWHAIDPEVVALKPLFNEPAGTARRASHDLAEGILLSDHSTAVMRYLSDHPDERRAILSSPNPASVYRALGRIEATVSDAPPPAAKPAPKSLSTAPPPPVVLGTKPSAPSEDWKDAVSRGDFSAYERAMNRV